MKEAVQKEQYPLLVHLFGDKTNRFSTMAEALEKARAVAHLFPLDDRVLDLLYRNTRKVGMARGEWESEVRVANAFNSSTFRWRPAAFEEAYASLDPDNVASTVALLTENPATLAIGYHGSLWFLRLKVFARLFPNGVTIDRFGKYAATNGGHALWAARAALLEGKGALMAPDGRVGKATGSITVLGAKRLVGDGAPLLAQLTGCNVVWFDVVRNKDGLRLKTARMPSCDKGEDFADYQKRFCAAYAKRVESIFTGSPRNIMLQWWGETFDAMLAGKVDTLRVWAT